MRNTLKWRFQMASVLFKHIYKRYPGGVTAVSDFNLEIKDQEFIILVGPSGCGKSTLLKHIIGLYKPIKGDILIRGKSIVTASAREKREIMRTFGVTYQGGALFGSMTVGENVALPLQEYTDYPKEKINEIVKEKGMMQITDEGSIEGVVDEVINDEKITVAFVSAFPVPYPSDSVPEQ